MTIGCNFWMICLKLNWFFYGLSRMLQFSQFVWALRPSVWDVFNNFHLIYATDRSQISSDQKRFFIALRQYLLSFFANTPFNSLKNDHKIPKNQTLLKSPNQGGNFQFKSLDWHLTRTELFLALGLNNLICLCK